jgi:hypothetical protein
MGDEGLHRGEYVVSRGVTGVVGRRLVSIARLPTTDSGALNGAHKLDQDVLGEESKTVDALGNEQAMSRSWVGTDVVCRCTGAWHGHCQRLLLSRHADRLVANRQQSTVNHHVMRRNSSNL